jgi:Domain of unknown function DUF11
VWPDARNVDSTSLDVYAQRMSDQLGPAPAADLSVSVTAEPALLPPGENATYRIVVKNAGPDGTRSANLILEPPPSGNIVSIDARNCNITGVFTPLVCGLGPVAAGASVEVSLVLRVGAGDMAMKATVYGGETDPDLANNAAQGGAFATGDFALTALSSSATVVAGGAASYALRITHRNGPLADFVTLTCSGLPADGPPAWRNSRAGAPVVLVAAVRSPCGLTRGGGARGSSGPGHVGPPE